MNNIAETLHPHPLNVEQWDKLLEDNVDRNFLLDGLTNGFKIIDNDADLTPFVMSNYKSATGADVKEKVRKQIISELQMGKLHY